MSDLISRQDAIDAIERKAYRHTYLDQIIDIINQLPSAQRKGKWLLLDGYRCSECNYKLQTTGLPSSCPNCGADMRGEEDV